MATTAKAPAKPKAKELVFLYKGNVTFQEIDTKTYDLETMGFELVSSNKVPAKLSFSVTAAVAKQIMKQLQTELVPTPVVSKEDANRKKALIALAKKNGLVLPSQWK